MNFSSFKEIVDAAVIASAATPASVRPTHATVSQEEVIRLATYFLE